MSKKHEQIKYNDRSRKLMLTYYYTWVPVSVLVPYRDPTYMIHLSGLFKFG